MSYFTQRRWETNDWLKDWKCALVLSSPFSKVDELLDEHWAKLVLSENISTPIYVECHKMCQSKVWVQEFWYFVSGLDIQLEQSKSNNPICRGCWLQNTCHTLLFLDCRISADKNLCLVVKVSWKWSGEMGSNPTGCWNSLSPLGNFTRHWACQCTDTSTFYIAVLSIIFFLGFHHWQSRADLVVNLNVTIWLPLFCRTWTWALAHTCPHVLAWHMGTGQSYCRASELTDCQVSGFVFSWFLENTEKLRPCQRLF